MRLTAYILLLLFSWQVLAKFGVIVGFHLNRAYIASSLCEQKELVNSTCQGSCYLKKQLKQQEEKTQDKNLPQTLKNKYEVSVFVLNENDSQQLFASQKEKINSFYRLFSTTPHINIVFRPPCLLV